MPLRLISLLASFLAAGCPGELLPRPEGGRARDGSGTEAVSFDADGSGAPSEGGSPELLHLSDRPIARDAPLALDSAVKIDSAIKADSGGATCSDVLTCITACGTDVACLLACRNTGCASAVSAIDLLVACGLTTCSSSCKGGYDATCQACLQASCSTYWSACTSNSC
jgi:hypothetical protein